MEQQQGTQRIRHGLGNVGYYNKQKEEHEEEEEEEHNNNDRNHRIHNDSNATNHYNNNNGTEENFSLNRSENYHQQQYGAQRTHQGQQEQQHQRQYHPYPQHQHEQSHYQPNNNNNRKESGFGNEVLVAQHYNARPDWGKQRRVKSRIIQLKNFNNWVKSVLISSFTRPYFEHPVVFDLAGGKGGDLLKWQKANVSYYVLADIATNSVRDAVRRFNENRVIPFPATFISSDICQRGFLDCLPQDVKFDVVSCQFALHYSFETEDKARDLMYNVSSRLVDGGYFIGSIPNAYWIVKQIKSRPGLSFGNSVYNVTFEQKDTFPRFGCKYYFTLEDAVDNCPEYLVHFPTLQQIASDYGLEFVFSSTFHQYYLDQSKDPEYAKLFEWMRCLDHRGSISDDEWEAAGIYMVFAFRKKGEYSPPSFQPPKPQRVTDSDIIIIPHKE